jgi:hypothetical protein
MFHTGDLVRISDDFDGSVVLHGWTGSNIENQTFEVVTFHDYQKLYPTFARMVKQSPSKQGEVFLKQGKEIFVLSPAKALALVKAAALICNCPINRLWAGSGHDKGCPEFPTP